MERIIEKLVSISSVPILILNFTGGIVGGIWLLIIGEWQLVIFGVLADLVFSFVYAFILLPTYFFSWVGTKLLERNWTNSGLTMAFLGMLIGHILDLLWVVAVFLAAITLSTNVTDILPLLLFGYSVATGPFVYMASKEPRDSTGSYIAVWLTQVSYILLASLYLIGLMPLALPLIIAITLFTEIFLIRIAKQEFIFNQVRQKIAEGGSADEDIF